MNLFNRVYVYLSLSLKHKLWTYHQHRELSRYFYLLVISQKIHSSHQYSLRDEISSIINRSTGFHGDKRLHLALSELEQIYDQE